MSVVFADSFFYLALLNKNDSAHSRARLFAETSRCQVVTTAFILIEVADALSRVGNRTNFISLLKRLNEDPFVTIIPPTIQAYEAGIDLYIRRRDKDWSLTDSISFAVMEHKGISEALTADHHFAQAGYNPLLALLIMYNRFHRMRTQTANAAIIGRN